LLAAALTAAASVLLAQQPTLRVTVTNELDRVRPVETVELPLASLAAAFRAEDLPRIRVSDAASGRELLAQAVDDDGDGAFDRIAFQAGFGPRETATFALTLAEKRQLRKEDFRVYGRFVRERFDDFAWENDRVAHRVYGPALETWEKEPLTSSGVDVWVKSTRALVVNDWYMVDDYHRDHGEGGDFYSAGKSRGCGGSGIWSDGRLFVSRNFRTSRVLANGPIRLVFELDYLAWDVGRGQVSETKRVTLDAGSHFNRFESIYRGDVQAELMWAAGIKKAAGADVRVDRARGVLRTWEAFKEPNGHLGCALVVDPARIDAAAEADGNVLLVGKARPGERVVYHAGSAWDRGGDVAGVAAWDGIVDDLAQRLRSPLKIEVVPR
jgi:pectinesterase